jgi:hypothetical protein
MCWILLKCPKLVSKNIRAVCTEQLYVDSLSLSVKPSSLSGRYVAISREAKLTALIVATKDARHHHYEA